MSANPTFVQALADATGSPWRCAPITEATTLGAGLPGRPRRRPCGARSTTSPTPGAAASVVEPTGTLDREQWARAVERSPRLDTRPVGSGLLELLCSPLAGKARDDRLERNTPSGNRIDAVRRRGRAAAPPPRPPRSGHRTGVGAAVSLLPFLGGRASASSTTGDRSTTTTVPPKRPTDDDVALLAAALEIELTAQGLYSRAISSVDGWTDAQATVMTTLRQAHLAFGNSLSGLLGKSAPSTRDEALFNAVEGRLPGSTDDVLEEGRRPRDRAGRQLPRRRSPSCRA